METCMKRLFSAFVLCASLSFALPVLAASVAPEGSTLTPAQAKQLLVEGNMRFVGNKQIANDLSQARRTNLFKNGQHPFATILSCADSRTAPEQLFDRGLGELFVLRVAGNVLVPTITGSIEFSQTFQVPLIVVMGHNACGAVEATIGGGKVSDNIAAIAHEITPAVQETQKSHPDLTGGKLQEAATKKNVELMVAKLKKNPELKARLDAGKLEVVGAMYDLESGQVTFLK